MAFTQITNTNITANTVVDYATFATLSGGIAPKITSVNVANSAFSVLDDTAVNIGGGYIVVTGENFASNVTVLIDTTQASAVTRVSSTQLRVQVPSKSAATYNLYVVNPDGGTGIKVAGLTYSSNPTWVTASPLANQAANAAFSVNFSATGASSYSVAAGSTLPAGTQLLANGYFYGTVSISSETTYSFVVTATDAENQDADKTFGVTVTVTPPYKLWSWGLNTEGPLGLNDIINRSSPVQVGTGTIWNPNAFAAALDSSHAIKTDGTLWNWGNNVNGQLGINSTADRSSPTQVDASTNWSKIAAHGYSVMAIKTDGTLWTWGKNDYGQLGLSDIINRSSPVQVGAGTTWLKIANGDYLSLAIKTDGTLWVWGNGNVTGLNTPAISRSSPTQIGSSTDWADIAAGGNQNLALKTNGTLWSWGNNYYGSLGLNIGQQASRSSPTQVGADTNWSSISIGNHVACAIKTNGTLWSWGYNGEGQLGQNDRVYRSSPVQIGAGTTWSKLNNYQAMTAIKTDGTLWSWGDNPNGNLGLNNAVSKSSPTQIGTNTNWSSIVCGQNFALAVTTN
jgi:hypothetical protein